MKSTIFLLILLMHVGAADALKVSGYTIVCTELYPNAQTTPADQSFLAELPRMYALDPKVADADRIRQMHDAATAYIIPAVKAACAIPKESGEHVRVAATEACLRGCTELNSPRSPGKTSWTERQTLCKADCGQGSGSLGGMIFGFEAGVGFATMRMKR